MDRSLDALAQQIIDERERRRWFLPNATFGEAGWEMLLLLYSSQTKSHSRQSLLNGALVPPSTGNRWLQFLEAEGLITTTDGREVRLTEKASHALDLYLSDRIERGGLQVHPGLIDRELRMNSRSLQKLAAILLIAAFASGVTYAVAC